MLSSSHKAHQWIQPPSTGTPGSDWLSTFEKKKTGNHHFVTENDKYTGRASPVPSSKFALSPPSSQLHYTSVPLNSFGAQRSFISSQPVSSVGGYALQSERQADVMQTAGSQLAASFAASSYAMKSSAALTTQGYPALPNPYLSTHRETLPPQPADAAQQHRVRSFRTSNMLRDLPDRLSSDPLRAEGPPITSSKLWTTTYHGLRDPDGTRRMLEVCAPGSPHPPPLQLMTPQLRSPVKGKFIGDIRSETASEYWSNPPKKNDFF